MRVYEVKWFDHTVGALNRWVGTKREAKSIAKVHKDESCTLYPHDVPQRKSDLIGWLNKHAHLEQLRKGSPSWTS